MRRPSRPHTGKGFPQSDCTGGPLVTFNCNKAHPAVMDFVLTWRCTPVTLYERLWNVRERLAKWLLSGWLTIR
jgi:hypothetical protein